jgi:hypothetical protein
MPDGYSCLGFMMERIHGLDLYDLQPGSWPLGGQEELVSVMSATREST